MEQEAQQQHGPAPLVPPTPPPVPLPETRRRPVEFAVMAGLLVMMTLYYLFEAAWFWRQRILIGFHPAPMSPLVMIAWVSIVLRLAFVPASVCLAVGLLRMAPWARPVLVGTLLVAVVVTVATYLGAMTVGRLTGTHLATLKEITGSSSMFYVFIIGTFLRKDVAHFFKAREQA
jgi:hypothetical protein